MSAPKWMGVPEQTFLAAVQEVLTAVQCGAAPVGWEWHGATGVQLEAEVRKTDLSPITQSDHPQVSHYGATLRVTVLVKP